MRRLLLACLGAAALAGCGVIPHGKGEAKLWITRDRGASVVLVKKVKAGQTAMAALQDVAKVKTRYGGRFVQSIDGVSGSLSQHRDWFYFVNGYEADRGASDYTLHDGDVEWWDYRSWKGPAMHVPVVVGAFPEPFLHGYDGKRRPAVVVSSDRVAGRRLAGLVRGRWARPGAALPSNANVLVLRSGPTGFSARPAGQAVHMTFSGDWRRLLRGRYPFRFRYAVG